MAPTPLIFLAACLLLVTRIPPSVCRAVDLKIFDKRDPNVNTATDEENDTPLSSNLKEKLRQSLEQNPNYLKISSWLPPNYQQMVKDIFAKEATRFLREPSLNTKSLMSTQEADQDMLAAFAGRSKKRGIVHTSLDVTFKLLLEMIMISKLELEHKLAAKNREIMDKVGK
ncbi:UI-like [Scyliorhinus canicula]|uniref:UI-like n=1 Tax=Scyliorhinus canicula TaxID=7830 RepID=UPI0018F64FB2|nr:UI-like [Scyliorhinus canicula]